VVNAPAGKRLAPILAELVPVLRSHTKPGSLLKSRIPMRTWADYDENSPGFVEIDLVGHEGGNSRGEFCFTLTVHRPHRYNSSRLRCAPPGCCRLPAHHPFSN